jgi:hypothetical protein
MTEHPPDGSPEDSAGADFSRRNDTTSEPAMEETAVLVRQSQRLQVGASLGLI